MSNLRVQLSITKTQEFKPINIKLEFSINTQEELDNWKKECEIGVLCDFSTEYSGLLYDVFKQLRKIK